MAELPAELGYPIETETMRARIEKIHGLNSPVSGGGANGLLLVAVTAADEPVAFVQAIASASSKPAFGWRFSVWWCRQ
ncbi:MAG TPA: hypothetical protein VGI85_15545, partial [Chthoniobacterales bacterium]